jgi:hypothetical protein
LSSDALKLMSMSCASGELRNALRLAPADGRVIVAAVPSVAKSLSLPWYEYRPPVSATRHVPEWVRV